MCKDEEKKERMKIYTPSNLPTREKKGKKNISKKIFLL